MPDIYQTFCNAFAAGAIERIYIIICVTKNGFIIMQVAANLQLTQSSIDSHDVGKKDFSLSNAISGFKSIDSFSTPDF